MSNILTPGTPNGQHCFLHEGGVSPKKSGRQAKAGASTAAPSTRARQPSVRGAGTVVPAISRIYVAVQAFSARARFCSAASSMDCGRCGQPTFGRASNSFNGSGRPRWKPCATRTPSRDSACTCV
jgi:hypothetical protein